jgi:GT2 family glycosyltransferase
MASSKNLKIAFLVVTWNNRKIIDECLTALQEQTYRNFDIYVIDNASEDDTAKHISSRYPEIKLTASKQNHGFAKGNNMLIRQAFKDAEVGYVALVNSDAVLDQEWASELISYVSDKRNVAAAQGVTLDYFNHRTIDAEHIYMRPNFQSVQYGYGERFLSSYAYPRRVFGVNAAAALYSRAFIEAQPFSNLFDEKFFMYLEDVDVSFRALVMGWDNYYVPTARAYHMGSVSSKKRSSTFNIQMTLRNQPALIFKNMPILTFFRFLYGALKFEKNFYKAMEEFHGKEAAGQAKRNRLKGIIRTPLYMLDRLRIMRKRNISHADLERIMLNDGIV